MSEAVKFNEEELKKVQNIQQNYLSIQNQFGQLTMARLRLEQQMDSLGIENDKIEQNLKKVQEDEQKFLDEVTKKYGQGTLDPETGLFTPAESENKS